MSILVRAATGLKVPKEGEPHRYINEHQAVAVEESAYYLRCLECGDLVRESEAESKAESEPDPKPAKGGK